MKYLLAVVRALLSFIILALYVKAFLLVSLLGGDKRKRSLAFAQSFSRVVLPLTGAKIERYGNIPSSGGLLLCNHRSYLDPAIVVRDVKAFAVAKAEVKKWPLIGWATRLVGVIFVERSDKESRKKTLCEIKQRISEGYCILNFPEGTTGGKTKTLPFNKGTFSIAAEGEIPIVPVALEYKSESDFWVGDIAFIPHALKSLAKPITRIRVKYGEEILSNDPEELLLKTKTFMDNALVEFRENWV